MFHCTNLNINVMKTREGVKLSRLNFFLPKIGHYPKKT